MILEQYQIHTHGVEKTSLLPDLVYRRRNQIGKKKNTIKCNLQTDHQYNNSDTHLNRAKNT